MMRGLYSRLTRGRSVELAKSEPSWSEVACPGCGGPTRDAGPGKRPRWTCRRAMCAFVWGWKLDFAEPLPPPGTDPPAREPSRPMVAIPYVYGGRDLRPEHAVTWPRKRA